MKGQLQSAVTVSLVPEARGGPFVFWDDLSAACRRAAELGFDAVEIFPRSARELDCASLERILLEHGLKVAAVGSGAGWVAHKLRLTDANVEVRERARLFAGEIVKLAATLGCPAIIGSMQGRWEGAVERDQALGWLAEGLMELSELAATHRHHLLFEPLNRYETNLCNNVEGTIAFLHRFELRNVKLLCDLFHMNIEEASIAGSLQRAGDWLGHVHLADSNRLAMGMGHTEVAPIAKALREMKYAGYISAEVFPLPDELTAAAQSLKSFQTYFAPK